MEAELTFPPGTEIGDTQCLGILIENDNNAESSENFLLNLMPATPLIYIEPERNNYTVTILDNDREYTAFSKFLARIVHVSEFIHVNVVISVSWFRIWLN